MSLPYNDGHYPCILTQLAHAHRPPSELLTQTIFALPIFCRMGSLFDPCYQASKGGEPEDGIDGVNDGMDVGMGEAAYPLENRESRLIDESRYAAPALQRY